MPVTIVDASATLQWGPHHYRELSQIGTLLEAPVRPNSRDDLIPLLRDAQYAVLAPLPNEIIGDGVFSHLANLRGISLVTARSSWVDIPAATRRGIVVSTLGHYSAQSVAEFAIGLVFNLARKISEASRSARNGVRWFEGFEGFDLCDKTLGVIGLGAIGSRVALLASGIGMRVVACARTPRQSNVPLLSLDELLRTSDVVVVAVDENQDTRGLLNRERLALLKPHCVVVNISRECVVDSDAIRDLLEANRVGGFAFEMDEVRDATSAHPLLVLQNVIGTPHIGWLTSESRSRARKATIDNIRSMIAGTPINVVTESRYY
jgi:D-3-phosphoglycerate dehydrogenase